MTGRRIRETEGKALTAKGVRHLVIAGLANAYAGYVATREEYEIQHYEGASTHFGPYTGSALRQEYHALADALVKGTPSPPGPTPRKLSPPNHAPGVFLDDIPSGKRFGSVDVDAAAHYTPGKTVRVTFWGGHPRNHLRTQGSFLEMQRKVDGKWHKVADDHSPNTRLLWRRKLPFFRKLNVVWKIPEGTPAGIYRIQHDGHAKHALTMTIKAYRGRSSEFHIVSDE